MGNNVSAEIRLTPPVVVGFAHGLFQARAARPGDIPRYGITAYFDKNDAEHMAFLKKLAADCERIRTEFWPDERTRPRFRVAGDSNSPIKDGDTHVDSNGIPEKEKYPEIVGRYFIRINSVDPPTVVDRSRNELLDKNKVYSGCIMRVSLNAYTYKGESSQGITFGLNGAMFWEDGERIGGGKPSIDAMFGDVEPEEAPAQDPFANDIGGPGGRSGHTGGPGPNGPAQDPFANDIGGPGGRSGHTGGPGPNDPFGTLKEDIPF